MKYYINYVKYHLALERNTALFSSVFTSLVSEMRSVVQSYNNVVDSINSGFWSGESI